MISFEEQDVNRNLYQDRHRRFKNETDVPRKLISNFLLKRQGAVSTSSEFLEIWRRRTRPWRFFETETRYSTRAISRKLPSFVAFVLIPSELAEKLLAGIGRINADETRELSNCNFSYAPQGWNENAFGQAYVFQRMGNWSWHGFAHLWGKYWNIPSQRCETIACQMYTIEILMPIFLNRFSLTPPWRQVFVARCTSRNNTNFFPRKTLN